MGTLSMELVTLAHVTFNRIGSASKLGMGSHNSVSCVREVRDGSAQTFRELVLVLAEERGEAPEKLAAMQEVPAYHYTPLRGAIVFDIQGPSVRYGTPYAVCYAYPALKIGDRYFKLDEVEL